MIVVIDNGNRVQGSFVSKSQSRWFIKVVLAMVVVAFVGISIIPLFDTAVQQNQPSTEATPAVSQTGVAEQKSKLEQEARSYEVVLQREPKNQTALQGLAQVQIQLDDLKGAIATIEKLTQLYPEQTQYHLVLGQVYAEQKNYDAAIAAYDRAIETDKQDFRPVLSKAIIVQQQGKTEQAKSLFQNAATLAPSQYKEKINQLATQQPANNTPSPTSK